MKLRYQALILICLTWVIFLAFSFISVIRYSSLNFIILTLLSALTLALLMDIFIFKRIGQLNHKVKALKQSGTVDSLAMKGNDEIANLANEIKQLFINIQFLHGTFENRLEEDIRDVQQQNMQLKQEIAEHIAAQTQLAGTKDALTRLAHYDPLTALPNRVFFNEILNKAMNHAKRNKKICAILLIDVNQFKSINVSLGHIAGDNLLKEIGNRLKQALRAEDVLAKLEGDQFIVLLSDIAKPKFASVVAEKLLKTCAKPIKTDHQHVSMTINIGISIYPNDGLSLEEILKNTETALENAKRIGEHRYQFYTQALDLEAQQFIQLESALRKAVENNELTLYYQPKLNIKRGHVCGVETLIRWLHPELGTIHPTQLIMLAEETGLIMKIFEWALREACTMNKYWQDEGYEHITVAVNLSQKQFNHPDTPQIIQKILHEVGLHPRYLELEIDESTVMSDMATANTILEKIKATGAQLCIDHFGTGYTSISHLKQFPISSIKIDKSFIKGLPYHPNDIAITNAFIALVHNLGLEVIAEGVETAEQVEYLSEQNCDIIQGYFLSHPLPALKVVSQFTKLRDEVLI